MDIQAAGERATAVIHVFREKNVTFLAGSIAYSAFVSLVPLVMFFLLGVALFGAPELQQQIIQVATDSVSRSVGGVLEVMIEEQRTADPASTISATVIGVLTLFWGGIKVFRGLTTAFAEIYETTARDSILGQLRKSLVMLVTLTLAVIAMVGTTTVVALFSTVPFIGFVVPPLLVLGLCAAFFPMYYLFPNVDVAPRNVLLGTVVGALGWAILQVLFQVYVSVSGSGGGSLIASILLLVTWLYFSAVVLLLGAAVNAVGHADASAGTRADSVVLETEMTRDEIATYLQGLRADLSDHTAEPAPTQVGAVVDRTPPTGAIAITEWAHNTDAGKTHEVRIEWEGETTPED